MAFTATSEVTENSIGKITLTGELDASVAPVFKAEIEKVAAQSVKRLVLLMSDLTYIASAGLRVLIFAKQKMGSGVDIFVIGAQEQVVETLENTGFHYSVTLLPEYDESVVDAV